MSSNTEPIQAMVELQSAISDLENRIDDEHSRSELQRARNELGNAGSQMSGTSQNTAIDRAASIVAGVAIRSGNDAIAKQVCEAVE